MACLNTCTNNEQQQQQGLYANNYPRISFSNDFVETTQAAAIKQDKTNYREAPSDFEFSLRNFNIVPADEIFSQGMLVPLKENCVKKMTLREELLSGDDDFQDGIFTPRKSSGWWKERLGLKRAHVHVMPKKAEMEKIVEENR
ncbi:hypothetical protein ACFE04_023445 [Oxalis oulophora]